MTTQQELLFTDLNALTEDQIEAGLAAGVWRESRPFVEQYLDQIRLSRADAVASAQGTEAIRSVVNDARGANLKATLAARKQDPTKESLDQSANVPSELQVRETKASPT